MGNQSKFRKFATYPIATPPEKTFYPAQPEPQKKTYTDFLSSWIHIPLSDEKFYDEEGLCYQEKFIFLSHVIGSQPIITIEED